MPLPGNSASGMMPSRVVRVDIWMGRSRLRPASAQASNSAKPRARRVFV